MGGSDDDEAYDVQQTTDGGYIVAGRTHSYGAGLSDVWLIKTDGGGDTLWTQTFGGSNHDYGFSVQQTTDGGYVVAGRTDSYGAGGRDVYLVKTDSSGIEQWSHSFGGGFNEEGYSVQQTSDGGYIVAGYTASYGAGSSDVYLIRTDAGGDTLWTRTFGTNLQDGGSSVQQTTDGGYIITGWCQSGHKDVWLIKTYASGTAEWSQTYGGNLGDWGSSVQQTSDGGFVIGGYTASYGAGANDVYIIKTDALGVAQWSQTCGGSNQDYGYDVQQTSDGDYIITGYREFGAGGFGDVWLIRLGYGTSAVPSDQHERVVYPSLTACPNPFDGATLIRFKIATAGDVQIRLYDAEGRVVATVGDGWKSPGCYQVPFRASHLCPGVYGARLTVGDFVETRKLVLMK